MFLLRRPSPALLERVLRAREAEPLSYSEVGMTRFPGSRGYPRNHHRITIGRGGAVYARAVDVVRRWGMYDLGWTHVYPARTPIEQGRTFATVIRHLGFWSINPCRIVYVENQESSACPSFSFAIGTLPGHSERGEERFRVEWDQERDEVSFEISALATAQHPLARLGYPFVRLLQRRFATQALHAVNSAVARPQAG